MINQRFSYKYIFKKKTIKLKHLSIKSFSVKSGYWSLRETMWNLKDRWWKIFWKFQYILRVRLFLWLVFKQCILTNMKRIRRGIGNDDVCSRCNYESEDILHMFRDCLAAKEVWLCVLPANKQADFFLQQST